MKRDLKFWAEVTPVKGLEFTLTFRGAHCGAAASKLRAYIPQGLIKDGDRVCLKWGANERIRYIVRGQSLALNLTS